MSDEIDWVDQWRKMMCRSMRVLDGTNWSGQRRCHTPDGIVPCYLCRYDHRED